MKTRYILLFLLFSQLVNAQSDEETRRILFGLYGESEIYEKIFYRIQSAITNNDREAVAQLNIYPVRVNFDSGTKWYKDEEEFISNYEAIVINEMIQRVKDQKFSNLFANWHGMYFGFGDVWFSGVCTGGETENPCKEVDVGITSYNVNRISK